MEMSDRKETWISRIEDCAHFRTISVSSCIKVNDIMFLSLEYEQFADYFCLSSRGTVSKKNIREYTLVGLCAPLSSD